MFRKLNNFIFNLRSKSMITVFGIVLLVRVIVFDEYQKITVRESFENISLKGEGFSLCLDKIGINCFLCLGFRYLGIPQAYSKSKQILIGGLFL